MTPELQRHLDRAIKPLGGWDGPPPPDGTLPDLRGARLAFASGALVVGGANRVMVEQMAALEGTGARCDVFHFGDATMPAMDAELQSRCPTSLGGIYRADTRLASGRSLLWPLLRRRYDLIVSNGHPQPLHFKRNLRKWRLPLDMRLVLTLHEEYARSLTSLDADHPLLDHLLLDYDFRAPLQARWPDLPPERMTVLAPLFPQTAEHAAELPPPSLRADFRARHGIPSDALVMGHVGRLDANKRIGLLVDLMGLLGAQRPRLHLVVAGRWVSPVVERQVRTRIAALPGGADGPVAARIHLLGHLPAIDPLLAASDLFLFASEVEGFYPLAILEAQAAGLPVVATEAGGLRAVLADGLTARVVRTVHTPEAALLPADGPATMAAAVSDLLDDEPLRQRIGANGRELALHLCRHYGFAARFRAYVARLLGRPAT